MTVQNIIALVTDDTMVYVDGIYIDAITPDTLTKTVVSVAGGQDNHYDDSIFIYTK